MSLQVPCPNCGLRSYREFTCSGEVKSRPKPDAAFKEWTEYIYFFDNRPGIQLEWWHHRAGCNRWFLLRRDNRNNRIEQSGSDERCL